MKWTVITKACVDLTCFHLSLSGFFEDLLPTPCCPGRVTIMCSHPRVWIESILTNQTELPGFRVEKDSGFRVEKIQQEVP